MLYDYQRAIYGSFYRRESKIYMWFTIEACYNYVDRAKDFVEKNINGHE